MIKTSVQGRPRKVSFGFEKIPTTRVFLILELLFDDVGLEVGPDGVGELGCILLIAPSHL